MAISSTILNFVLSNETLPTIIESYFFILILLAFYQIIQTAKENLRPNV